MNYQHILEKVDHTQLAPAATWAQVKALCEEAVEFGTASVCIAPAYVAQAHEAFPQLTVCTVIGFPNGYNTTACKVFETKNAIENGAEEIDMVINLGWVKDEKYDRILDEIREIKAACGAKTLKVIIETCLLTETEKMELCRVVSQSGAEFIKTSTGFSTGGATPADVTLMRHQCAPRVKVKAAGGISSLADAEKFLSLGADRLGTSRIVKLVKEQQ